MIKLTDTMLENYEIHSDLGSGSFGTITKAWYKVTNSWVALKCFQISDASFKSFFNEMKLAFRFNQENIVKILDISNNNNIYYIAYDYMNSGDLRNYIELSTKINIKEVIDIIIQVSKGLDYIHSLGITHRDLKPENIMIHKEKGKTFYKITDFGISKYSSKNDLLSTRIGSPAYMAPERYYLEYDYRVDFYSLGIIFYELVTKSRPFRGNLADLMNNHLYNKVDYYDFQVPEKIKSIINKLLEKDPNERYQSALDLLSDLDDITDHDLFNEQNTYKKVDITFNNKSIGRNLINTFLLDNQLMVITKKRAFILNENLKISMLIDKEDIKNAFIFNKKTFFIKNKSLYSLYKENEELKEDIFLDLGDDSFSYSFDYKTGNFLFLTSSSIICFSLETLEKKVFSRPDTYFDLFHQILFYKDNIVVIKNKLKESQIIFYSNNSIKNLILEYSSVFIEKFKDNYLYIVTVDYKNNNSYIYCIENTTIISCLKIEKQIINKISIKSHNYLLLINKNNELLILKNNSLYLSSFKKENIIDLFVINNSDLVYLITNTSRLYYLYSISTEALELCSDFISKIKN
ncbi:MAG: serine/threonine-protein kinase [Candidatus Sericytochromatia bacterium]